MSPLVEIRDLRVAFRREGTELEAVRGVSLDLRAGESVAIVGESGSGKTQLCMALMGLLPANAVVSGAARFAGEELLRAGPERLNSIRGSRLAMIFQDPQTALTPHLRIGVQMAEVLVAHRGMRRSEARDRAREMLRRVGMHEPARCMERYPHELSGGMRQRVMIGMSLLCGPDLVIADEPTTALDVTVQAQVLELLARMRRDLRMAILLVSHDLSVVAGLAERIIVMYAGRVVEDAPAHQLLHAPRHPYTAALIRCVPAVDGPIPECLATLRGQPPTASQGFDGCAFAPRCELASAHCKAQRPPLSEGADARLVACHTPLPS